MVCNVYFRFFDKHGCTYWWIKKTSAHCKHVTCNTLTHSTYEGLLNINRKGDPKSPTLSRTSDTTETRNPCVIKVILLVCSNLFVHHYFLSYCRNKSSLFLDNLVLKTTRFSDNIVNFDPQKSSASDNRLSILAIAKSTKTYWGRTINIDLNHVSRQLLS
jgi:hypothetical protein